MKFAELPIEVLAQILSGSSSFAAIMLWCCGNGILSTKLANGGVRDLSLETVNGNRAVTWPQCLKRFRLRALSVTAKDGYGSASGLRHELKQLCPHLKTLEVCGLGAMEAFFPSPKFPNALSRFGSGLPAAKRSKTQEDGLNDESHVEPWT